MRAHMGTSWPQGCTLVILTGGASRRLGRDKATTHVGGAPLLDRLLRDVPPEVAVVVVGPPAQGLPRVVVAAREDPPGSGPLAAMGAGLAHAEEPLVGVLAADMPFALPVVAEALQRLAADPRGPDALTIPGDGPGPGADCVIPVDPSGRHQPLCAAYRARALREALAALGPLRGRAVRDLLPLLRVVEWPVPADRLADVDTVDALAAARAVAAEEVGEVQEWVQAVREALGVQVECDIDAILDVARDAAHSVQRPAAPVTTYLLGAAVAGGADVQWACARISELAAGWDRTEPPGLG